MTDVTPIASSTLCEDLRPHDRSNANRFTAWSIAAAIVYVLGTFLLHKGWVGTGAPAVAVALLCMLPAAGAVGAYRRFLAEADELVRRIHLEGFGYGLAASVLFGLGWTLLELAGVPRLGLPEGVVVTLLAWALGQVLARRRYR